MKDIKVCISDEDIDAALEDAESYDDEPRSVSAEYVGGKGRYCGGPVKYEWAANNSL